MRVAILTDSSSDLVNNEVNNIFVLPLPIIFPNQIIVEDIKNNVQSQEKILNNLDSGDLKTSALNPGILEFKMKEILAEYDHVIYFPIAFNLSSQYQNSLVLLNNPELTNKITIVKHYFTGMQLGKFILGLLPFLANIENIAALKLSQLVKEWEKDSLLTVIPGDLTLLNKGGRVNKLLIKFLTNRKFKVAILWSSHPKKIISKDYQNLIAKYCNILQKHFKNSDEIVIYLAHTPKCDNNIIKTCANEFARYKINVNFTSLPSVFAVHGGSNTIGLIAFKTIEL